ncbi:hypothetical protein [Geosporobacter ferrireducens]|uniref:Uncharacterized protein n=1 Tax=Geosporobacter ferrireducens TaxID=1424294 RepID=A0A1D8GKJ3_9FIRM|nr:hypothetical protein [Geosporobacter ferrireducens]AOT71421.1 hypothetical protein Gferi_18945 [Geosporobacter ferrireducens]MTI57725.1 hypothetical protein [Geosporobacter ferrireducens]
MVILLRRLKFYLIVILVLAIASVFVWMIISNKNKTVQTVMGGYIHTNNKPEGEVTQVVFNSDEINDDAERFQRPSKEPALKLKYTAKDFIDHLEEPPYIQTIFQTPEDVIQAYYAILKDAANMNGYHGGCGTIGWAKIPYPYAYELLTKDVQQKMPLEKFVESFAGIGHMTLLKLYPAYQPPGTADNIKFYMVEIEVITGPPYKGHEDNQLQPSFFAYYYGLITTEKTPSNGWKIKSIDYVPEDFLCHPFHHWDYDAKFLVKIVYQNWYGLIDEIEKVEKDDSMVYVFASGSGHKYRFDFVRITNGDDVLLHENILENGQWKEVNLLKEEHQVYKFSILNPNLKQYNQNSR